jgi:uncharacterized 2Fe-2S/4Fe-4S cluster protein (DUF4445 family)
MDVPEVIFLPTGRGLDVEVGTTILDAARAAGVVIEAPCNGVGTCGKCKVKLDKSSTWHIKEFGKHKLSDEDRKEGYVLACQSRIQGNVTVTVSKNGGGAGLKIVSDGVSHSFEIESGVKKEFNEVIGCTYITSGDDLIGTEGGDTSGECFGVVVDIGTTTLVASLIDLKTGRELASASSLNPQATHAQDVLSRIKFASNPEGLEFMCSELTAEINAMIRQIASDSAVDPSRIYEVVYSGNTCMLHLATATDPISLGKYPYEPALYGGSYANACELGLKISEFGRIYLPPIIASYVGADITSGVLAARLDGQPGNVLFVDIGTNGEVVLARDGVLSATSTAAGPAFEGMNIAFGMRAALGAIEEFEIAEDGDLTIRTVGNTEPKGICGSGLLDIVGELAAHGAILKTGRFARPESPLLNNALKNRIGCVNGKPVFFITDKIYISQEDIRQVQLAKGAIRAGIEMLLLHNKLTPADLNGVLIAGSFGYHLREKSILNIGLLPSELEGKIEFLGNTSKSGGKVFLLNNPSRESIRRLVKNVSVIELSICEGFDRVFAGYLGF